MRKKLLVGLAIGLMTFGVTGIANADLITNGSFEVDIPTDHGGTWQVYSSGITGWTVLSGAGIEIQRNAAGSSYAGLQHVELDSHNNSAMGQLVTTLANQYYDLSFAYSPRPNQPASTNGIEVWWDGALLDTITATGVNITSWTVKHYTVQGDGSDQLAFMSTTISDSYGGYIDAVKLAPIPEPATMLLFGAGIAGLAGMVRRKRS